MIAEHYSHLTTQILRETHSPIILHIKKKPDDKKYNHYILFLGVKNDNAIIYDTPNQIKLVPFHILASLWSGVGLVVSDEQIKSNLIFAPAKNRFIIYAAIISGVVLSVRILNKNARFNFSKLTWHKKMGLSIIQTGLLLLLSLFVGYTHHFCNEGGFLFQPSSISGIQAAHQSAFIPKVSKRKVRTMINGNATFIDARLAQDFCAGHLNGAINIPVNSSDEQRYKIMADIAKNNKVIVYCQSSGCPYAKIVAIKLIQDGYKDISIFKGGWVELQKLNESQSAKMEDQRDEKSI